jgi:hypothetical protein
MRTAVVIAFVGLIVGLAWTVWRIAGLRSKPPVLQARLEDTQSAAVAAGSPVLVGVYLSGTPEAPSLTVGGPSNPWYSQIEIETTLADKLVKLGWTLLGQPYALELELNPLRQPAPVSWDSSPGARLNKSAKTYSARFALAPEDSARLTAGRYLVWARLGPILWPPWNITKTIVSNSIVLTITDSAKLTPQQQNDGIARTAQFYLDAGRFQDAQRLALQLKDREPRSVRSWTLLGDALNGLRRDEQALDAYNEALMLAAKAYGAEPPTYVMMRWHEVMRRLDRATAPP